jgi:hypothetical protein
MKRAVRLGLASRARTFERCRRRHPRFGLVRLLLPCPFGNGEKGPGRRRSFLENYLPAISLIELTYLGLPLVS